MTVDEIGESPILALIERIFRLRAQGEPVVGLHIGEPDFDTPAGIRDAAYAAMNEGWTRYAPAAGLPELRAAIAQRLGERHRIPVGPEDVVVLPAKFAIYATLLATVGPGDEVLLPDPTYLFEQPIRLIGAKPVYFPSRENFAFDPNALFDAITPRAKLLLLVSPANPTGRLLRRGEIKDALEIAARKGLTVVSDETYESLVYDGTHVSPAALAPPEVPVVTIGSFSKLYAMTGWRAGYLAAPPAIRARVVKVVEHTLTCVPPFVQRACVWALAHGAADEARFREAFRERRDHLLARLDDLPGISCVPPEGAFYAFPRYDLALSSVDFCTRLLEEERLALVPGVAFGPAGERHVRLSFTSSLDTLEEGIRRLRRFLERHGAQRG
ncbi:MAG TPA: aminotransferase class I/II-fold pyridoxal phosphate-dependent enzyme [Thermoplasmata archaeon]|nr:aminotransferase class I/II-fold pyridoxal phosphate-dependent enzyme [Thermoplasmata archaeon]